MNAEEIVSQIEGFYRHNSSGRSRHETLALIEGELTQLRSDLKTANERVAELEQLREAVEDFAKQKTTSELVRDDIECPDFEGAYDHMIHVARAALPRPATGTGNEGKK